MSSARPLPVHFAERVYAAVLGKIIGVYLGRPFEGWSNARIEAELGEVWDYVHDRLNQPLIVTDDDITGTFTFFRALEDHGFSADLSPHQVGETWLNYIIEKRTILWWGGMGNSTEHTAYLRMKRGIMPPASGSIALNGQVVAEQIGAQIFIDAWGLACPNDPAQAVKLARAAGQVSHDGEAVYAAQFLAALLAEAFANPTLDELLDRGLRHIPSDCLIRHMVNEIRRWRTETDDWRVARQRLEANYGYEKYGGNCHVIPNHGLIILALLYGDLNFSKSLMIVNTGGWDTDCNSGNVGCLLGALLGLDGIQADRDWRGPVADRLLLPTIDGARAVSDAVREADAIVRAAHRLRGLSYDAPKSGARFHFSYPGSVQGFQTTMGRADVVNVEGTLRVRSYGEPAEVSTPVFADEEARRLRGYEMIASPSLLPGQRVRVLATVEGPVPRLLIRAGDHLALSEPIPSGQTFEWVVPALPEQSAPERLGIRTEGMGEITIDWLTWDPTPPEQEIPNSWGVAAMSQFGGNGDDKYRGIQDEGTGLVTFGDFDWTDMAVQARLVPHLARGAGVAVRVQGFRRYYSLELRPGTLCLVRQFEGEEVLVQTPFEWTYGQEYELQLCAAGTHLVGRVVGGPVLSAEDDVIGHGGVAHLLTEGRCAFSAPIIGLPKEPK